MWGHTRAWGESWKPERRVAFLCCSRCPKMCSGKLPKPTPPTPKLREEYFPDRSAGELGLASPVVLTSPTREDSASWDLEADPG